MPNWQDHSPGSSAVSHVKNCSGDKTNRGTCVVVIMFPIASKTVQIFRTRSPIFRIKPGQFATQMVGESVYGVRSPQMFQAIENVVTDSPVIMIYNMTEKVRFFIEGSWNPFHFNIYSLSSAQVINL